MQPSLVIDFLLNRLQASSLSDYLTLKVTSSEGVIIEAKNRRYAWIKEWLDELNQVQKELTGYKKLSTFKPKCIQEELFVLSQIFQAFIDLGPQIQKLSWEHLFYKDSGDQIKVEIIGQELERSIYIFDQYHHLVNEFNNLSSKTHAISVQHGDFNSYWSNIINHLKELFPQISHFKKNLVKEDLKKVVDAFIEKSKLKHEYPDDVARFLADFEEFTNTIVTEPINDLQKLAALFNDLLNVINQDITQQQSVEQYAYIHRSGVLAYAYKERISHGELKSTIEEKLSLELTPEVTSTMNRIMQDLNNVCPEDLISTLDNAFRPLIKRAKKPIVMMGINQRDNWASKLTSIPHNLLWDPAEKIPNPFSNNNDVRYKSSTFEEYGDSWQIQGISMRGLSHQKDGTYCDDFFNFEDKGRWKLLITADGMGSAPLGRMGSAITTTVMMTRLPQALQELENIFGERLDHQDAEEREKARAQLKPLIVNLLIHTVIEARRTLSQQASYRGVTMKAMNTTFLMSILRASKGSETPEHWVFNLQIGDGAIFALSKPSQDASAYEFVQLTSAARGVHASETLPITSPNLDLQLPDCIMESVVHNLVAMILMTDGVSEDAAGEGPELMNLMLGDPIAPSNEMILLDKDDRPLRGYLRDAVRHSEEGMTTWINYLKRQSHDDRTLLVMNTTKEPFFTFDGNLSDVITKGLKIDKIVLSEVFCSANCTDPLQRDSDDEIRDTINLLRQTSAKDSSSLISNLQKLWNFCKITLRFPFQTSQDVREPTKNFDHSTKVELSQQTQSSDDDAHLGSEHDQNAQEINDQQHQSSNDQDHITDHSTGYEENRASFKEETVEEGKEVFKLESQEPTLEAHHPSPESDSNIEDEGHEEETMTPPQSHGDRNRPRLPTLDSQTGTLSRI